MNSWFYTKIVNAHTDFLLALESALENFQKVEDQIYVFSSTKENYNEMNATNDFRKAVSQFYGPPGEKPELGIRWLSPLQVGRDQSNWADENILAVQKIAEEFIKENHG